MNKEMKKIFRTIVLSSLALAALCSCSQEQLGVIASSNSDDNREIHFIQSSMAKEFPRDTKEGVIAVTLARQGNKGTYRVVLQKQGKDADMFSLRDTVVIPDGQYSVDVPVRVDLSSVVLGSTIDVNLAIVGRDAELGKDPAYISQYSDFLKLSASFALEWEPYMRKTEGGEEIQQLATYYFGGYLYDGVQTEIPVEVATGTDNIFRLVDWAAGANFMFKVDWKSKTVVVPGQSTGYYLDSEGQYVYVADLAQYVGNESMYNNYPCTWDGAQTFTVNVIYYVETGYFGMGEERIVFAGDHDSDPVIEVEYKGAGEFHFDYNSFAKSCRAKVVAGDISEDEAKIKEVYKEICLGTAEDVRTFSEQTQVWTPESVSNTLVAVPFDEKGTPGEAVVVRFTYDKDGTILPQIISCELRPSDADPYTTLEWKLKTKNVSSARVVMMNKDVLDYYLEKYDLELIYSKLGSSLTEENLAEANSEAGLKLYYQNAAEGAEYKFIMKAENQYGDVVYSDVSVRLNSHADKFESKTIDDFVGAYLMSATSYDDDSQSTSEAFRVDVVKTGENTVSVKGLCNSKGYSPALVGTFVPEENCIRLYTQNLGVYNYMNVVFGFVSDLYTAIWDPKMALEFGFSSDGNVYWRAMDRTFEEGETKIIINGYKFMLFSDGSYSGYSVNSKYYTDLIMVKL